MSIVHVQASNFLHVCITSVLNHRIMKLCTSSTYACMCPVAYKRYRARHHKYLQSHAVIMKVHLFLNKNSKGCDR